ncbi:MAG: hypothetical protein ABEH66_04950 [Halobacteriales archaeon]
MERHETRIEDGRLYVETGDGDLDLGSMEDVLSITGGETYTITYEEDYARVTDWLDLDEAGEMTIDVRDTLATMSYPRDFVGQLAERSMDAEEGGVPERTRYFTETMIHVWEEKGNLDDGENPFLSESSGSPGL